VQVDLDILIAHGASMQKYQKGDIVFEEGNSALYFFQIMEGEVKMFCMNEDGKEHIQGIFKSGESFGEPPLFVDRPYPATSKVLTDSVIIRLSKDRLFLLIMDYPHVCKELLSTFALRIYNKSISAQILTGHSPCEKIISFLKRFKEENHFEEMVIIPYTRQQIADFTGLRVETVIRNLSKLNTEKKIKIINHKVYY